MKFFRSIRHRLLTEKRFSKYLLYALGEILIVILGILMALQVNNYSEEIKEREIYLSYLLRLKEDFLELQETVAQRKEWEAKLIELAAYQLAVLTGEETSPDTLKLALSIEYTASINRYEIMSPTYLELNGTGRLALIKSDSLKRYLSGYHKYLLTREDQKEEWEPWIHEYRSLVRNILDPKDRWEIDMEFGNANADLESPKWQQFTLRSDGEKLIQDLKSIPGLTGHLQDILTARDITYSYMDYEFDVTHEFLRLIQSEIDRLQGDG